MSVACDEGAVPRGQPPPCLRNMQPRQRAAGLEQLRLRVDKEERKGGRREGGKREREEGEKKDRVFDQSLPKSEEICIQMVL